MFEAAGIEKSDFNIPSGAFEFTPITLKEVKGLDPYQIIEYKALCGDTSDNIPGVKGVGEKAVIPLLEEYGNIENIYDLIENLSAKEEKELKKFFKEKLGISRSPISYMIKEGYIMTSDMEKISYKCIEKAVTDKQIEIQDILKEKLGEDFNRLRFPIELLSEDDFEKLKYSEIIGIEQSSKESAFMSKELATIKTDIDTINELDIMDLKLDIDKEKLKSRLLDLEIKSLIK